MSTSPDIPDGAKAAHDLAEQSEIGSRVLSGLEARIVLWLAFVWSAFQLYVASKVPFWLSQVLGANLVLNNTEVRIIHLSFAIALAAMGYPLFKRATHTRIPLYDWALIALGVASCWYLLLSKEGIASRAGLPTGWDMAASTCGLAILALSVYRALGLPMLVIAGVFVLYVFFGHLDFLPDVIQWKGASAGKALWHYWMQTEGVFGVALGVSASVIFLFVLFGSLLERAGAGAYFIRLAFALLGHMRGGPAKAAVAASAMSGLYSGSSIANVVTTGTFTIPLMKRTGLPAEKAGAVEVASSTNGQLTPPVMGAAAFLITEFVGISYTDVIRHAFLPAVISYIALVYIVHLEALKLGLRGLKKPPALVTLQRRVVGFVSGFLGILLLAAFVYYCLGWVKGALPPAAPGVATLVFLAIYVFLVRLAARHPDLAEDEITPDTVELPRVGSVAVTGLHFLLPIVILLWCILLERLSPALSAFWATSAMIFIVVTQHPIKAAFRGDMACKPHFVRGWWDFVHGMVGGARNMVAIGVATGVAGIIIGSVSLTGAHQIIGEFVEFVSGGSLMLMLLLVAVMSLVLGMGLPTTANYIVVSSLMAGVIVELGAQHGLVLPLIAVHLFVFYFGILADDTPPVGLAAFAASAISGGNPIKTGIQGFAYDIRTALLPFLFLFNTDLLLIDVGILQGIVVFVVATVAMMLFAAATQHHFLVRNRWWEGVGLLVIALTLFRPGYWLDRVADPLMPAPAAEVADIAAAAPDDGIIRLVTQGEEIGSGKVKTKTVVLPLGAADADGEARLDRSAGLVMRTEDDGRVYVDSLSFGGKAEKAGLDFDWEILKVELPNDSRPPKEVFYLPALALLAVIVWAQLRRRREPGMAAEAPAPGAG